MRLKMAERHLVLLPGLDGTGTLFATFLHILPEYLTASVVTYPQEEAASFDALIPSIRDVIPWNEPYALVAESFAGPLALKFASVQPENLQGVVLVSSFVTNPVHPVLQWAGSLITPQWFQRAAPDSLLRHLLAGDHCSAVLLESLKAAIASVRPAVLANRLKLVCHTDAREALRACPVPVLYLLGEHDNLVGRRGWDTISAVRPDAKCATFDAPHLLLQSKPVEALEAIQRFLADFGARSKISGRSLPQ